MLTWTHRENKMFQCRQFCFYYLNYLLLPSSTSVNVQVCSQRPWRSLFSVSRRSKATEMLFIHTATVHVAPQVCHTPYII